MREDACDVIDTILCGLPPEEFDVRVRAGFAGQGYLEGGAHDDEIEGAEQNTLTQEVAIWEQWVEGTELVVVGIVIRAED